MVNSLNLRKAHRPDHPAAAAYIASHQHCHDEAASHAACVHLRQNLSQKGIVERSPPPPRLCRGRGISSAPALAIQIVSQGIAQLQVAAVPGALAARFDEGSLRTVGQRGQRSNSDFSARAEPLECGYVRQQRFNGFPRCRPDRRRQVGRAARWQRGGGKQKHYVSSFRKETQPDPSHNSLGHQ